MWMSLNNWSFTETVFNGDNAHEVRIHRVSLSRLSEHLSWPVMGGGKNILWPCLGRQSSLRAPCNQLSKLFAFLLFSHLWGHRAISYQNFSLSFCFGAFEKTDVRKSSFNYMTLKLIIMLNLKLSPSCRHFFLDRCLKGLYWWAMNSLSINIALQK
jgi:hypothetical protein